MIDFMDGKNNFEKLFEKLEIKKFSSNLAQSQLNVEIYP